MLLDNHELKVRTFTCEAAYASEDVSSEFIRGMLNRMGMSRHKYGSVRDTKGKIDHVAGLKKRLALYEETGNAEWLMDVANMAMIEFIVGNREGGNHYRPTDSDESPGRVGVNGAQGAAHNDSRLWGRR